MRLFKSAAFGFLAGAALLIAGAPQVATRVWANNSDQPFDLVLLLRHDQPEVNNMEFTDLTGKSADQVAAARLAGKPRKLGQDSKKAEDQRLTLGPHTRWLVAFPQSGKVVKTFYHAFSLNDKYGYVVQYFTCDDGPLNVGGRFKLEPILGRTRQENQLNPPRIALKVNQPQDGCLTIDPAS